MSNVDPRALRSAFGSYMTGVTVVTSFDADDRPCGFTANSFASVSLEPPLLLVCIGKISSNYNTFSNADKFAVNILSEGQKEISNTFARPSEDRFVDVNWSRGPHGSPLIEDASAWFDCSLHQTIDAGDHLILLGLIKDFKASTAPGLGYARGAYFTPAAEAEVINQQTDLVVSALITNAGRVLMIENESGQLSLPQSKVDAKGASSAVVQLIANTGAAAEPGFVYAVVDNEERGYQYISFLCEAANDQSSLGEFKDLSSEVFGQIKDHSTFSMLERFKSERELGMYGVFYGTDSSGEILKISS